MFPGNHVIVSLTQLHHLNPSASMFTCSFVILGCSDIINDAILMPVIACKGNECVSISMTTSA